VIRLLFRTDEPSADGKFYQVRQTASVAKDGFDDCVVEFQVRPGNGEWYPVDSDAECASVYMMAFLAERAKTETSQAMEAFLSMKTSIEDHVGQTDERVTKKMVRNVVRHYVTETDPTVHHARKEIEARLLGVFGLS
jgi:hypothetical protein